MHHRRPPPRRGTARTPGTARRPPVRCRRRCVSPPGQRAHAEHDDARERGPRRARSRAATSRRTRPASGPSTTSTKTGTRTAVGVRLRVGPHGQVSREKPTQQQELDGDREPATAAPSRAVKWSERQARGAEGQQVGQVGHRQQQRRGVGQMRGGVGVRSGRHRAACAPSRAPPVSAARRSRRGSAPPSSRRAMTNTVASSAAGSPGCAVPSPRRRRGTGPRRRTACASTSTAARNADHRQQLARPRARASSQRNDAGRDQQPGRGHRDDRLRPAVAAGPWRTPARRRARRARASAPRIGALPQRRQMQGHAVVRGQPR